MWWLGLLIVPSLAFGFTPPPNDGFLTDAAGVLTAQAELEIEDLLQEYAQQTGTEIAVIVVQNVGTASIEEAAKDIAQRWRVGVDDPARGVVLLFSYEDRNLFIVIGDGLKGVLSPDVAQGIIARDMIPLFRSGRYADGIGEGVKSIVKHISGEYTIERYDSSSPSLLSVWLASIVGVAGATVVTLLLWTWWRRDPYEMRRRRRVRG